MQTQQMLREINEIFIDVLDLQGILVTEETKIADLQGWDSLTHIQLTVAIERHFKIRFSSLEINNWKTVGELMSALKGKVNATTRLTEDNPTELEPFVDWNSKSATDIEVPSYRSNCIKDHPYLKHGVNCFVAEGATLTNVQMGDRVWVNRYATVYSSHGIVNIGSDCYIGPYVWIEGHAGLEMGNSVHIGGPGTSIYTHSGIKLALKGGPLQNPEYKPEVAEQNQMRAPIRIGNNVWIGPGCFISPGTVIQDKVIVMPHTLVKSGVVESHSMVYGDGYIEQNSHLVKTFLQD